MNISKDSIKDRSKDSSKDITMDGSKDSSSNSSFPGRSVEGQEGALLLVIIVALADVLVEDAQRPTQALRQVSPLGVVLQHPGGGCGIKIRYIFLWAVAGFKSGTTFFVPAVSDSISFSTTVVVPDPNCTRTRE
jgi:hypothetical protein